MLSLRAPVAEIRLATRLLTAYALAFPEVGFRLTVDGKARLTLPRAASRRERIGALYGPTFLERVLEAREERPAFAFEAWLGVPEVVHAFIGAGLAGGVYALGLLALRGRPEASARAPREIEEEVRRPDRRRRLVPFAAMILIGVAAAVAWSYLPAE